jgi:hypothetical protein
MASINAATAGGGGVITTSDATGNLNIQSGGSTVVAVTSAGVAVTGTGKFATTIGVGNATPSASGSGITFPATQSASSNANTLDDYEEGTWTPTVTSAAGSLTAYTSTGNYTKIGNNVYITFTITIVTAGTASGYLQITNAPFTAANVYYQIGGCSEQNSTGLFYQTWIIGNTALIQIATITNGGVVYIAGYKYAASITYIV